MQAALRGVDEVYSLKGAFAGVLKDGKVVTWVDEDYGGNYPPIHAALRGVQEIYCAGRASGKRSSVEPLMMCRRRCEELKSSIPHIPRFFQLREGPVVTWGSKHHLVVETSLICRLQ